MARRRYRKRDEGLFEIALRSDWKVAAGLAAASVFVGVVLVPAFFGASPVLRPMDAVFAPVAWLFAFGFACIALIRFLKQAPARSAAISSDCSAGKLRGIGAERPSAVVRLEPTEFDRAPETSPPSKQDDLCCAFCREKGIRAETTRLGIDGGMDIR